ncbi:MAG: sulfatase [Lentisphaerae bacterium]|jgi:arylsulfatase A-like enzyme|nr:sulfatase [Lentisphaerota bacterium]MBT5606617.1 sulfatase [Lentisphaerota bacterium]MBT7059540.1 sulfatase [Lentisphaerota bacterium]MBT7843023.1 sulfatase [Lentisphaerota bacterium]
MNCVVICCDTFRHDMIGHPTVKTPALDALRAEGIQFTNAFAEGLPTIQARRTSFTGLRSFPWRHEMGGRGLTPAIPGWHRIPDEQMTLSEMLLEGGVVTGLIGDTYHMFKPTQNFTRGFCSWDFIRGQEGDPVRSGPLSAVDVSPYHPKGENDLHAWPTLTQYLLNMLDRHTEEDYLTPRVFRRACTWLEENRENDPWFLWIDSFAPHERWDPPMEFADAYCTTTESRNYIQPQLINRAEPSEAEIERTKALYHGYVTFVDKWIGVFLDKLAGMHLLDDTLVVFTSDHGTELWDKDRFGKGGDRLYRYNTGIPLIVRLPGGLDGGTVREDFVQHQDLLPTICGALGVTPPNQNELDGRNVFAPDSAPPEKIITAWHANVGIRDHAWNLVLDSTGKTDRCELYDLQNDPHETRNVAAENPQIVTLYTQCLEDCLGPLPYDIKHTGDRRQAPPLVVNYAAQFRAGENG